MCWKNEKMPWNLLTFGLVGFFAMFQFVQWPDLPRFMDIYYHLSVASGFSAAGGYVPSAFWECAPVGRPHLYPPLLHVIMLGLSHLGLSWIAVGRLVECLLMPSFLLAFGFTVGRLHSPGAAFFAVLAAASLFSLYLDVSILSPFTLAIILGLLALPAVQGGKAITGAILLGLAFYTHIYMAAMLALAVLAYGLLTPRCRIRAIVACLLATLLASPLFIHVAGNRDFFTRSSVKESRLLEVHPLIYLLAAAGLVLAVRRNKNYVAPVCVAVAMLPLFFTHIVRSLGGYGLIGFIWLAGVALYEIWLRFADTWRKQVCFVAAVVLLLPGLAPVLHINTVENTFRIRFLDSTVTHFFLPDNLRTDRAKEHSIYSFSRLPEQYAAIAAAVLANTATHDIIWADAEYQGAIIALLTDRATSSATMREVRAYKDFDGQASARVLIWFKTAAGDIGAKARPVVARYDLRLLAETEIAYVFLNPAPCPKVVVPDPLLCTPWIGLILLVLATLVALDISRRPTGCPPAMNPGRAPPAST